MKKIQTLHPEEALLFRPVSLLLLFAFPLPPQRGSRYRKEITRNGQKYYTCQNCQAPSKERSNLY